MNSQHIPPGTKPAEAMAKDVQSKPEDSTAQMNNLLSAQSQSVPEQKKPATAAPIVKPSLLHAPSYNRFKNWALEPPTDEHDLASPVRASTAKSDYDLDDDSSYHYSTRRSGPRG